MIQPQRRLSRGQKSNTLSLSAPTLGWNVRDNLADMDARFAIQLDNWFPTPSDVKLRAGSIDWSTGLPSQVNSLMTYNGFTSSKLFAASATAIYDVTANAPVGAAVVTGLTSDYLQHVQFTTPAGVYLMAVNGLDYPKLYNGTTWADVTNASSPGITGVDPTTLVHICLFKQRLFFVQKNSLSAWYLPVLSIGGAASELPLGTVFKKGGYLVAMASWSLDAGAGADDYAVFITSTGEVAIYMGTDPSSASTWALKGVFEIGSPMGRRCFTKMGGDLCVINKDGLFQLSRDLMSSRVNNASALSDNIMWAVSQATTAYASNQGWQTIIYPPENALLLNIPVGTDKQIQYVMNTVTNAWSSFSGWSANCFALFKDRLYYGGNTKVVQAWSGQSDNGAIITGSGLQAFSYFNSPSQIKKWNMAKPVINATGNPNISLGFNVDFDTSNVVNSYPVIISNAGIWDQSKWDQAVWGGMSTYKSWESISGVGTTGAVRLNCSSNNSEIHWVATSFVFERGGIL